MKQMTTKQEAFAREYLLDMNGKQAAIRAGYAPEHAEKQAHQLMKQPEIKALVAEQIKVRFDALSVNADWVLSRLKHEATYYGEDCSHGARVAALATLTKCLGMLRPEPLATDKVTFVFNGFGAPVSEHRP